MINKIKGIIKKIIPKCILELRKSILKKKYSYSFIAIQENYKKIEKKIAKNVKKNRKIRIGFYLIYDSSWGARPLFEKLIGDNRFKVSIVVCPDTSRGLKNQNNLLISTYERLVKKYGYEYVLNSYNDIKDSFIDYSKLFDIISFENPYDSMTYKYFQIKYLIKKGKLTFFNSYAYQGKLKYDEEFLMKSEEYSLFWKLFVDNQETVEHSKKNQIIKGKNVVLSGYCKMDNFINKKFHNSSKTILLAPHHTVESDKGVLHISNFLKYADFFLNLPKLYPNINIIFRPHPLLIPTLKKNNVWGEEKTNKYLEKITNYPNVFYSTDGEYIDDFNKSDALIDDCGSFLVEYFYTGKPQCYMLKNNDVIDKEFSDFGKEILNHVYKAFSENDILNFIDNVLIKNQDCLLNERLRYAKNHLMINYPNVCDFIIDHIYNIFK